MPSSNSALYSGDVTSTIVWVSKPDESRRATTEKDNTPAPPMAKATGKPDRIAPKRMMKVIMSASRTPSIPNMT